MSTLTWAAAGGVVLLVALVLVRGRLSARRGPGDSRGRTHGDTVRLASDDLRLIRGDIQSLHVVRTDLHRVGDLLERLLEETMALHSIQPSRPEPARGVFPGGSPQSSRVREASLPDSRDLRHGELGWGADAKLETPAREPSRDALPVEASNDAIVRSERHPPEAWLERRGGDAEVWLNPRVTLTDPALQRWSTFFDWERREPGARYQADRPAVVTWSGEAGSVLRKGAARPL